MPTQIYAENPVVWGFSHQFDKNLETNVSGSWGTVKTEQEEVSTRDGEPLKLKCDFTQIPNFNPGKLKVGWEKEIENNCF